MIYGPESSHHIYRVQPVDEDMNDHEEHEKKKRKVQYNGRSWAEKDEDLPVQPSLSTSSPPSKKKGATGRVYPDQLLLRQAQKMFDHLLTLEEKVAQLCFLETEAVYDTTVQDEVEMLIQTWQIGGILFKEETYKIFKEGHYRRQAYLIEHYQEVSEISGIPLLIANDFFHGLSLYLQGDSLPKSSLSEKLCSDLGKAVMDQNRALGVHVQFDRERRLNTLPLSEKQAMMFRKGIRDAHGIVGKEKLKKKEASDLFTVTNSLPFTHLSNPAQLSRQHVEEIVGLKTLDFFDGTQIKEGLLEQLFTALQHQNDILLLSIENIVEAIRSVCKLVRSGRIRESDLDRHILKILIIKAHLFNSP